MTPSRSGHLHAVSGFLPFPRFLASLALVLTPVLADPQQPPKNACLNGGFEKERGGGYPEGWGAATSCRVDKDAHTGKNAVRLTAARPEDVVWMNYSLPKVTRGKLSFSYKAVRSSVKGKNLIFFLIPMRGADGMKAAQEIDPEGNASGRISIVIGEAHLGDGKWHRVEVPFDFTDLKAGHCIIAPRINEFAAETGSGELLLDDVEVLPE
jgi:hypothetical protein